MSNYERALLLQLAVCSWCLGVICGVALFVILLEAAA